MRFNRHKAHFVSMLILFGFSVIVTALSVVLLYRGTLGEKNLNLLFWAVNAFLWALVTAMFVYWRGQERLLESLRIENRYSLGNSNVFFNYYAFENKVRKIKKYSHRKGESDYVVAFSASDESVMRNLIRNDEVTKYNADIADYLNDYFRGRNRKISYCFYHGLFLIYYHGYRENLSTVINDIRTSLYHLVDAGQIRVFCQPFFGIAEVKPGESLITSVDNAVTARSRAETTFEQEAVVYTDEYRKGMDKEEIDDIVEGLRNNEFVVYYQPKFSLERKEFISSEALIRWNSSKHGFLPPSKFVPKAEYSGLIHLLDMFVLEQVCKDLNETKRKRRRLLPVSVNFSLNEFFSPTFIDDIMAILDRYGVDPSLVEIEVTEATSQANTLISVTILQRLKDKGFRILMDDFGVYYSNFNSLMIMPIDVVKIDKSYVDPIVHDTKAREIVKFLISLCKVNGFEVVAEGVDNIETVDILKKIKCDTIQGYYFSKPIPKEEFDKMLLDNPFEKGVKKA